MKGYSTILVGFLTALNCCCFSQSIKIDSRDALQNSIREVKVTEHFLWKDVSTENTEVKWVSNVLETLNFDTLGNLVKHYDASEPNTETTTHYSYDENNSLVLTKTISSLKVGGLMCGGRLPIVRKSIEYDKIGRIKSEKVYYNKFIRLSNRGSRLSYETRRMFKVNYLYNEKGLLHKKVYMADKNKRYDLFEYEYYKYLIFFFEAFEQFDGLAK